MADHKLLYRWSLQDAIAHNEVQDWRDSYRENCDCARAIERSIADHYHDNILENGTKDIIDRYGFDRVNWVLANTLQEKAHDGRFSQDNKRWAKGFFIPSDDVRWHFCVESHPGLTDLFINQTREAWQNLGLFDASHCSEDNDYAGKLLILKPSVLKDEFKASDYQLFYAESGFGCSPTASGRKVFGKFLKDGENMFSVPRGYTDGFNQWCKQVAAICLTAFMQTTLLFLGLLTFPDHMLLGLGIMLAANEVPRIAQQFGLDSSVKVNMMSVVHATTTAVNLTRSVARATGK